MQRPISNAVTVLIIKENLRLKASAISLSNGSQKLVYQEKAAEEREEIVEEEAGDFWQCPHT